MFASKEFEVTPILEEIRYFTSLKHQGRCQIIPHSQLVKKFLRYLGLNSNKKLRWFKHNWVSLDYLYESSNSYKLFRKKLTCTYVDWQGRRPIAFAVAVLEILVFPREYGYISTCIWCICSVARVLFKGVNGEELTLVPMILGETFRSLEKCKKRGNTFL